MRLTVPAYAKINLSLDVVGRRANGYHDLRMVMQTVSLADTLTVETKDAPGFTMRCNAAHLPTDGRNLVIAAAEKFFERTGVPATGLAITLEKRIPVAAGLAGGSTDAAAMLRVLDRLFSTGLSADALREMALTLGADVPYCVEGGTMLAEGIGEVLTPAAPLPDCHILLCKPPFGVSTPEIFKKIRWQKIVYRPDTAGMLSALEKGSLGGVARRMYNVLETVTGEEHTQIRDIRRVMLDCDALGSAMSGSGPTVVGIFDDEQSARSAYTILRRQYHDTFLLKPVGKMEL